LKNKFIWLGLSFFLVAAVLLASCSAPTTSTKTTSTTTTTKTTTKTTATTTIAQATTTATNTATTTAATGNWWDSLGTPQYGGTIVEREKADIANWDPIGSGSITHIETLYMEGLFSDNWTLAPSTFNYRLNFRPNQYVSGNLAESYEFTDPSTVVVHLRQGIHWQDIPPANGRLLTAADIVYSFHRLVGGGDGFTTASIYMVGPPWSLLTSVTATNDSTVVFKWNSTNQEYIYESMQAMGNVECTQCPESVKQYGDLSDWHHAIGTGPFIISDYVSGGSATAIRNSSYWQHDERYPNNSLPYVDKVVFLIMPDNATALAAMRTGKIDVMDGISLTDAQNMKKTNPAMVQIAIPVSNATSIDPRDDKAPFNDIKVREAMQLSINLSDIAENYYGGTTPADPSSITSNYMTGWGFPYSQWPQDLKDQYAFNVPGAKALLTAAGYSNGFHTTLICDQATDMTLLQIVKSDFAAINIDMTIQTMDSAGYSQFIAAHKNMELCQRAQGGAGGGILGNTTEPMRHFMRYWSGYVSNIVQIKDPTYDAFYVQSQAATTVDQVMQLLKQANQYIAENHFSISLLQPNLFSLSQPWLKGYTGQNNSVTGVNIGLQLGFYDARFWIDKSLK
jgi:peptide/nickel transport system substrate-binding protein